MVVLEISIFCEHFFKTRCDNYYKIDSRMQQIAQLKFFGGRGGGHWWDIWGDHVTPNVCYMYMKMNQFVAF